MYNQIIKAMEWAVKSSSSKFSSDGGFLCDFDLWFPLLLPKCICFFHKGVMKLNSLILDALCDHLVKDIMAEQNFSMR